jgi:hypothetical protein
MLPPASATNHRVVHREDAALDAAINERRFPRVFARPTTIFVSRTDNPTFHKNTASSSAPEAGAIKGAAGRVDARTPINYSADFPRSIWHDRQTFDQQSRFMRIAGRRTVVDRRQTFVVRQLRASRVAKFRRVVRVLLCRCYWLGWPGHAASGQPGHDATRGGDDGKGRSPALVCRRGLSRRPASCASLTRASIVFCEKDG